MPSSDISPAKSRSPDKIQFANMALNLFRSQRNGGIGSKSLLLQQSEIGMYWKGFLKRRGHLLVSVLIYYFCFHHWGYYADSTILVPNWHFSFCMKIYLRNVYLLCTCSTPVMFHLLVKILRMYRSHESFNLQRGTFHHVELSKLKEKALNHVHVV